MKYILYLASTVIIMSCANRGSNVRDSYICSVHHVNIIKIAGFRNKGLVSEYHKFTKLKKRYPNPIPVGKSLKRVDTGRVKKLSYTVPTVISYCPECEKMMTEALAN